MENVIGVFIVWASVVVLSFVVIIAQFQWRKIRIHMSKPKSSVIAVIPQSPTGKEKSEAWLENA